jgi:mRNA-degrading endonuclease RelE of RelBE toxin-antitoxin system
VTVNVILSDIFQKSYDKLDGSMKSRVLDFIMKVQQDPGNAGLDLKIPKGAKDKTVRTARVNDNFRAVLFQIPAGYTLAYVGPHDDAYSYAERAELGVNPATSAAEINDHATAVATARQAASAAALAATPLLAKVNAADLGRFGLNAEVAAELVRITHEDQLIAVADTLPRAQSDVVLDLAAGRSPDAVWADLMWAGASPAADTLDIEAALARPLSRLSFTSVSHNADLQAALEGPFERWRVFLHPSQRSLAYRSWNGPVRVTGGPGTGKTVTALHRASHLASQGHRVALVTFTKTLRDNLEENLIKLAGRGVLGKVDVLTVDALARRILTAASPDPARIRRIKPLGDNTQEAYELWREALAGTGRDWQPTFLAAEWALVVLARDVRDRQAYFAVSRSGRGHRLNRLDRAELWDIFQRFEALLDTADRMTYTQIAALAAATPPGDRYDDVVVDEVQDLNLAQLRMLRNVAPGMFLVGDSHQRIYGSRFTLSAAGIETRGRSRRLTVNYRTSREILRCCLGIVTGATFDDLDGETETLVGYRSEFTGPEPVLRGYATVAEELAALALTVDGWQQDGIASEDICVVARTGSGRDQAAAILRKAGHQVVVVDSDAAPDDEPGVRVMTMHRAKGLEFRAIAVVGTNDDTIPYAQAIPEDETDARSFIEQDRCLLYVACSRARERLAVSWTGTPSRFLPVRVQA